ncbi:MAG: phage baseplate assembly protein [Hyphomicrobium sp.]|uniref:phage baseplate assembly protein n=1 Tax=Hyphomicrobium sp. TaxID=82 RepID=UPI003D0E336C
MMSGLAAPGFRPGIVSLLVGGMLYEGWKKVSVSRSVREMAGQFTLEVSEKWTGGNGGPASLMGWRIRPGDPCTVLYSGFPVITGYVDTYCPKYDADSHEVTIQGRSKTQDLVDSSADPDVENGEMRDVGLDQIANKLAGPHGVGVKVEAKLKGKFDVARVQSGETKHEMLERYARPGAVLLTDDELGNLRLLHVAGGGAFALIEGENILEASATLRADNRYSDYEVKGQDHGNDQRYGREVAEVMAKARDGAVKRYRPHTVRNETKTSKENARDRCDWEATSRGGESTRADVTVVDWIGPAGLWMPGQVGVLVSPMLAINRSMAIESLEMTQDENGTLTKLSLVPPEALKPPGGGGGASAGNGDGAAAGSGGAAASDPAWRVVVPHATIIGSH